MSPDGQLQAKDKAGWTGLGWAGFQGTVERYPRKLAVVLAVS
jgi:hypothetical protein